VPLGLLVNELITNALKYAFPVGRAGQIEVTLDATAEGLKLTVSDNGLGVGIWERVGDGRALHRQLS
jgi:two-component sensor histidine kinase